MKTSDAGWFGAGALLGGVVAGVIFREHILSGKILIVSDGSVRAGARGLGSRIRNKGADKPQKHQWTGKPDVVHVAYGLGGSATCDQPVASVEFSQIDRVELRVAKAGDLQSVLTTIIARKEGSRLYLEMADGWEFEGNDGSRELHGPGGPGRLESVTIHFGKTSIIAPQTYSATADDHLCATFEDQFFLRR